MALAPLQSEHFPYLPLTLTVRERAHEVLALVDTGFDGDLALPLELIAAGEPADEYRT